jgi:hypothetical protein
MPPSRGLPPGDAARSPSGMEPGDSQLSCPLPLLSRVAHQGLDEARSARGDDRQPEFRTDAYDIAETLCELCQHGRRGLGALADR